MGEHDGFQLSQGLTVLAPRSGKAYPIPCDEWKLLKEKIQKISTDPWFFHTLGSILIGAGISTIIAILTGALANQNAPNATIVAWAISATTIISGTLCLLFSNEERKAKREHAGDVVAQMTIIEQRYEHPSA